MPKWIMRCCRMCRSRCLIASRFPQVAPYGRGSLVATADGDECFNEEALSASTAHLPDGATPGDRPTPSAPRYSEAAGIENHPQVTDFLPRRYRTIGCWRRSASVTTAAIEALHMFVASIAGKSGSRPPRRSISPAAEAWQPGYRPCC